MQAYKFKNKEINRNEEYKKDNNDIVFYGHRRQYRSTATNTKRPVKQNNNSNKPNPSTSTNRYSDRFIVKFDRWLHCLQIKKKHKKRTEIKILKSTFNQVGGLFTKKSLPTFLFIMSISYICIICINFLNFANLIYKT